MPLDPKIQAMLDLQKDAPAMHTLPVDVVRRAVEEQFGQAGTRPEVGRVEDRTIDGPGGPLRLRIYRPEGQGPFPLIVFFHGSGFCICSLDTHDPMCRHMCNGTGAVVCSVDYRLAPEHPYPAGPDDCLAATRWAAAHAAELDIDPGRIAVAGDSAGGAMAAVTALRIRDEGGPKLAGQWLIYPVTDHYEPVKQSMLDNATGYGLMHDTMKWFWDNYLRGGADTDDPRVSPLRARNLGGLAPALVQTAQYDVLLDEGEAYAKRLREAGVPTQTTRYDGMNHGFLFMVGTVDGADRAMEEGCAWLRERFATAREKAA
jgi:acetyl esterase